MARIAIASNPPKRRIISREYDFSLRRVILVAADGSAWVSEDTTPVLGLNPAILSAQEDMDAEVVVLTIEGDDNGKKLKIVHDPHWGRYALGEDRFAVLEKEDDNLGKRINACRADSAVQPLVRQDSLTAGQTVQVVGITLIVSALLIGGVAALF